MLTQRLILSAFLLSLAANLWFMAGDLSWWCLPAALFGWFLADLYAGLIHMFMDYHPCPPGKGLNDLYFYEGSRESEEYLAMFRSRMATINAFERVCYDFKNHHPRPQALGRRSLWRLIGSTVVVAALPVSLAFNALMAWTDAPGWLAAGGAAYVTGGAFAQYFHGSLHRDANPWFIEALRKVGLLMTPAAHQLHHDTLQQDFATNCGWSNPLVNWLFRTLHRRGHLSDSGLTPTS